MDDINRRGILKMMAASLMYRRAKRASLPYETRYYSWNEAAKWERLERLGRQIPDGSDLKFDAVYVPPGPKHHYAELGPATRLAAHGLDLLRAVGPEYGLEAGAMQKAFEPVRLKGGRPFRVPSLSEGFRRYFRAGSGWVADESMWTDKARMRAKGETKVYQGSDFNKIVDRVDVRQFEQRGYICKFDGTFIPPVRLAVPHGYEDRQRYNCKVAVRTFRGLVDAGGLDIQHYSATWLCLVEDLEHKERFLAGQVPAEDPAEYNDEAAIVRRTSLAGLGRVEIDGCQRLKAQFTGLGFEWRHDEIDRGVLCVRVTHRLPLLHAMLAASDIKDITLTRALRRI